MKSKANCYGKMFPDVMHMVHNEAITGKVFGYRVDHPGISVTHRATTINREQWQRCLECSELDGCYRLSIGTILMELAAKN